MAPAIAALACGKPGLAPPLDQYTCDGGSCAPPGVMRGQVLYGGEARGDAILLLFDTGALPPPDGDGPVAIARVPRSTLFARAPDGAPFSASFTFTQVRPGRSYQIRAFIDTSHQFNPLFDYTQQPRGGDPVGGYGEIDSAGELRLLSLRVGPRQAVDGITVRFTQVLAYDPPSFELIGGSQTLDQGMDQPARLGIRIAHLPAPGAAFANAHFALELDRDAQGNPRSTFGDGLYDVFPRVFLRQLTSIDGQGNTVPLAPGAGVIVPCRVVPLPVLPALLAVSSGEPALPRDQLELMVEPFALGADLRPLDPIPAGEYQIVVVQRSGQVWTLPNQLGDPAGAGTPYFSESQAQAVTIAPLRTVPANSVSGAVVWSGGPSVSGNIVVQAYRDDPYDPAPPLGAALPVRVQAVPASAVVPDARGFRAPYRIGGLPPGRYIVHGLADVDGNFSPFALLGTPTAGDLVGAAFETGGAAPASIAVSGDVADKDVMLARISSDPPAFEIDPSTPARMPADRATPMRFRLRAKALSFPAGKASAPRFDVQLVRDAAGAVVDLDRDGLPDLWPRVFLVRLDPSDPSGLTEYRSPGGHKQALAAAIDPTPFLPALRPQPAGNAPPVLTASLEVIVRPALFESSAPGAPPRRLAPLPASYRIVLLSRTGQIWQIPNEAGSAALDPRVVCASAPCAPGTVQTQSQSDAFQVLAPAQAAQAGGIAGSLTVTGGQPIAAAYVFAHAIDAQPPFGLPVSADFHPGTEFQAGTIRYALPNLPGGDYLVSAIVDTRGDFAATPAAFAMSPGEGTLVAPRSIVSVGTTFTSLDLTAAVAMPGRPAFQLPAAATGADLDLPFNGGAVASMQIELAAILDSNLAPLRPDTSGALALACTANGRPDVASVSIELIKVGDAAGLVPELDSSGKATVVSGVLEPTQFSAATCAPGGIYAATGSMTVLVQKKSSAKLSLVDPRVPAAWVPLQEGRYAIAITSAANQVWRVPNELQLSLLDPAALLATPAETRSVLQSQQTAVNIIP